MSQIPDSYQGKPIIHRWDYKDEHGAVIGIVARYQNGSDKKHIVPFFRNDKVPGIILNPRPLYGLEWLKNHPKNKSVFIVEGERCASALLSMNITAVTSQGGCKAAHKADWTPISGFKNVYIWPDNDASGRAYCAATIDCLKTLDEPPLVKIINPEGMLEAGDCIDWIQGFIPDWDGFKPVPHDLKIALNEEIQELIEEARPPENKPDKAQSSMLFNGPPNDIKQPLPPVSSLETEMIPAPYRDWLADVAHRMQSPADFATISALVITGSVIGSGCSMRPKKHDSWEVIPNLWGACIGRPSVMMKSPSMSEATRLLDRLQAEYGHRFEKEKAGLEFDQLTTEAMLSDVKIRLNKAAKGAGSDYVVDKVEIAKLRADYEALLDGSTQVPKRRLFKTNECTVQAMTALQQENPRGLLLLRDELPGLLARWEREDHADERAYFLEAWNGDGSYTDSKIGRGLTDAKNICVSLLGSIQPDKLSRYLYQATKGNNDGMLQRLQLVVWPDEPKTWANVDAVPDIQARQAAYGILSKLASMDFTQHGATLAEHDDRPYYNFTGEAQKVFNEWLTHLQTVKLKQEDSPLMLEHLGKYRSLMPSLALIFHLIGLASGKSSGQVGEESAILAISWCEYLEGHARRVYSLTDNPEHEAAVKMASKIKAGELSTSFTTRDVIRKNWHGLKERSDIQAACEYLREEGWLTLSRKPMSETGRPPLPEYHINPFLTESA